MMFDQSRLFYFVIGLFLVIQTSSSHKTGSRKNVGAFCANDTTRGDPNLIPIDESEARLINKVENGTLYQIGSGEDQTYLIHVYGSTGYDYGYAYGTLLRDQIHKVLPRAWAHFEQEIIDALKDLKLPKWFEELIAEKGLPVALDVQNDLVKEYIDEEIYNEMRGISDAAQIDYKTIVRLHMLGEITRGKSFTIGLIQRMKLFSS
jgi:isopenicillin-N N-acyltransferase-like protein